MKKQVTKYWRGRNYLYTSSAVDDSAETCTVIDGLASRTNAAMARNAVLLDEVLVVSPQPTADLVALDDALNQLA